MIYVDKVPTWLKAAVFLYDIQPPTKKLHHSYYHNQANLHYFSGHYRQRDSGFDALTLGIRRVALPLARNFVIPAANKIGKELLLQAAPELGEVATKRKSPKQALTSTVRKTIKKQLGGGSRSQKIIR